jgi:hypothetical protein
MSKRKLSAWDLIDEVMTDMSEQNFGYWSEDKISFRNALIEEIKGYIVEQDIELVDTEIEDI